jgi:hypothetical protein
MRYVVALLICGLLSSSALVHHHTQIFTRRTFLARIPQAVLIGTAFGTPYAVGAYERRDVGGEGRSAEQAAYNDQAYETNNRLERQGYKLETAEEQKASLTAALSNYSYAPSTSSSAKNGKKDPKEPKK